MDRKQPPPVAIAPGISYIRPEEMALDNGLRVVLLEGGVEEIVKLEMVFFAGSYYQPAPLLAYSVANLLGTGTSQKTSAEINRAFDFYGTFFHAEAQKDIASFSVFVLQKHLEPVIELFQEIIGQAVFPDDEMELFLKNQKQQHQINNQRVQYVARTYFNELLFGQNHPYGYMVKNEDFDSVKREDILSFYRNYYHPANAFCIVSGRLPANIREIIATCFGRLDWPAKVKEPLVPYMAESASEKKVMVQRPQVLQSAVRVGRRLFNRTHPDYHRLVIANTLLGGFFGSRLMQNIRQEKGYTYGIGSNLVSLLRDGYFFIATEVGVGVCQKAIDEVYKELRKLRSIPASESELAAMKAYLAGDYLRSFDGPFAQSQRYKELLAFHLDASHFDAFLKELQHISAHQIMQIAEKYLHEDSMIELVVGKK